jgi:hypothetical protein
MYGEVYSIQHYRLSVTCDKSVVFLGYSSFPPPINLTATILLKATSNTVNQLPSRRNKIFVYQHKNKIVTHISVMNSTISH